MFEKYTEKGQTRNFSLRDTRPANWVPDRSRTEHVLLGLLREDKGLTSRFFPRAEAALDGIRKQIEGSALGREKVSTSVELPLSDESKKVLTYAAEEADRLLCNYIGTEHILLGLFARGKSRWQRRSLGTRVYAFRGLGKSWPGLRSDRRQPRRKTR